MTVTPQPLRLAFMGTPDFALPTLDALAGAGHHIAAVYCQPPRPAGRGQQERLAPVHARAVDLGLTVRTPTSLKTAEAQAAFAALDLDAAVVVAYGLILPPAILAAPRLGCLNVHASLLPRWRGAARRSGARRPRRPGSVRVPPRGRRRPAARSLGGHRAS